MSYFRILLVALLIRTTVIGQVCVVGSTEPPPFYSGGVPVAWPKTNVYSAPTYVGYVDWNIYCGYVEGVNGSYFSCPSISLDIDMGQAIANWNSASSVNGSTVQFYQTSDPPSNPGGCGLPPCFNRITPWIQFVQEQQS
jgi:hypothetical protein